MKSKITKQKWFVENYGQPLAESQMLYQKQGEFFRASATANERCGHSYGHSFARASFFIGNKPDNPIQPITEMQAKVFWPNLTKD